MLKWWVFPGFVTGDVLKVLLQAELLLSVQTHVETERSIWLWVGMKTGYDFFFLLLSFDKAEVK